MAVFPEMDRAERETLSERFGGAGRNHRLGRREGSSASTEELRSKQADIVRKLNEGHSVRNSAKITSKNGPRVQRMKATFKRDSVTFGEIP
jgi:hypothetical protein